MKDNGKMIKQMGMVYILTQTELSLMDMYIFNKKEWKDDK